MKKPKKFNPYDHPGQYWSEQEYPDSKEFVWTVCTEKGAGFDCETQEGAEILSRLVRIENLLKKKVVKK